LFFSGGGGVSVGYWLVDKKDKKDIKIGKKYF
jgi:hypothetical protein